MAADNAPVNVPTDVEHERCTLQLDFDSLDDAMEWVRVARESELIAGEAACILPMNIRMVLGQEDEDDGR